MNNLENNILKINKFKKNNIICNLVNWNYLEKIVNENNIQLIDFVGKGHRGVVFKGIYIDENNNKNNNNKNNKNENKKIIALKVHRLNSKNTIINEGNILLQTNKFSVGPKLYKYSENYLIMDYLEGINLKDYLYKSKNINKKNLQNIVHNTLKQCLKLDLHNIDHTEIQGGKHIIVGENGAIKLLDFDKSKITSKPHNFTSAVSLFFGGGHISKKVCNILEINLTKERDFLINLLVKYKKLFLK